MMNDVVLPSRAVFSALFDEALSAREGRGLVLNERRTRRSSRVGAKALGSEARAKQ